MKKEEYEVKERVLYKPDTSKIEIILIKRSILYWLWRLTNGLIPLYTKTIKINIIGLNTATPNCKINKCGYDIWIADFGKCIQSWFKIEIDKNHDLVFCDDKNNDYLN